MNTGAIRTHYDAEALAAMQLPGLPTTRPAIFKRAKTERWAFIEVQGKGGKGGVRKEYAPPAEVMEAIRAKAAQNLVSTMPAKRLAVGPENQLPLIETEGQSLKADARKGVLLALELLMQRSGYPLKKAARALIDMARKGQADQQLVNMLKMARDERGRSSPDGLPSDRSLLRFVEYQRGGMLAPKKRERDLTIPAWAPAFLACYQRPEKPTVEHAYREFLRHTTDALGELPSVWQVRRFLSKVGNVTLEMGRMGDRELKTLKPFIRRGFDSLLPADIYSADGHTFDAEVQHPMHGRPFRPEITSVVDIATRKAVGWSVGLAESAFAVLDALRDAVFTGGIPAVFYVDNGSGYKNELMTDVATGLMARLGIEMKNSLPYNSQARGVIEKLHQTIWVNAAKEVPGYMGRDMDRQAKLNVFKLSRKAIAKPGEANVMPLMGWPHFVEFCKAKVDEYNNRPHRSLDKTADPVSGRRRHMTPNEAWALAVSKGFAAHTVQDDEARPLFRPQVLRTVRRCEIELFGNRYFARVLEEFHSEQLRIGYDIHNPDKVWAYDADGRFICTAELDANKRDYMPKSVIQQAREKRAAGREKRLETKLVEVREELYGLLALEQVDTVRMPGFMTITREQLEARARQAIPVEIVPAAPVEAMPTAIVETAGWIVPGAPEERWTEWQRLNVLREEELDCEKQKKWRQTYQATAEFRTYQRKSA
ncbi:Mu transposase C-terminal domain-containing protein [Undibacterium sp. TJN25]|uniref:Mu transposase C-terminal domain-containing protein n=1 Tax=Undibacterium sp. TJN25 TaxID=3413056 RepID=UPI003BF3CF07